MKTLYKICTLSVWNKTFCFHSKQFYFCLCFFFVYGTTIGFRTGGYMFHSHYNCCKASIQYVKTFWNNEFTVISHLKTSRNYARGLRCIKREIWQFQRARIKFLEMSRVKMPLRLSAFVFGWLHKTYSKHTSTFHCYININSMLVFIIQKLWHRIFSFLVRCLNIMLN